VLVNRLGSFEWPVLAEDLESVFPREVLRSLGSRARGLNAAVQQALAAQGPRRRRAPSQFGPGFPEIQFGPQSPDPADLEDDILVWNLFNKVNVLYRVDELYREFWAEMRREGCTPVGWVPWTAAGMPKQQQLLFLRYLRVHDGGPDNTLIPDTGFSTLRDVIEAFGELHQLRGLPQPQETELCAAFGIRFRMPR
jgi:hypothetical protein